MNDPVVRRFLIALLIFVAGGLVVWKAAPDTAGPDLPHTGPALGDDIEQYIAARRDALEDADGIVFAVVSLTEYHDDDAAEDLFGDVSADRWLVAAPGATAQSTDDVETWRETTAKNATAEAKALDELLATTEDVEFERQYARDRDLSLHAAEALESGAPVVFGAVVHERASVLRALSKAPGVRLVDVVEVSNPALVRGLRPEETRLAGQPPERP
ncbi:MAG TPA: hypothetical protein VI916_04645 [Acidimicrobiia bacterium]|nr:hypothetical protein [Acidimicrobiia bacterium]